MKCAAIGPRGGQCHRQAQPANGWVLDFCKAHNQMVRDGQVIQCGKCGGSVEIDHINLPKGWDWDTATN
jgi:hypothetical protein